MMGAGPPGMPALLFTTQSRDRRSAVFVLPVMTHVTEGRGWYADGRLDGAGCFAADREVMGGLNGHVFVNGCSRWQSFVR